MLRSEMRSAGTLEDYNVVISHYQASYDCGLTQEANNETLGFFNVRRNLNRSGIEP